MERFSAETLAQWASEAREQWNVPGIAVAVLRDGETVSAADGLCELGAYCNTGFWFAAAAIARALDTSFEEAMRTRVLDPLGLRLTGFEAERPARGHDQVEPGAAEHATTAKTYPRVRRPSGGLWSSVADLLRFAAHHLGGPGPLTPASIAEMQR